MQQVPTHQDLARAAQCLRFTVIIRSYFFSRCYHRDLVHNVPIGDRSCQWAKPQACAIYTIVTSMGASGGSPGNQGQEHPAPKPISHPRKFPLTSYQRKSLGSPLPGLTEARRYKRIDYFKKT